MMPQYRRCRLYALLMLSAALSGCTTRLWDFTVMSTRNVPIDLSTRQEGEGDAMEFIVIVIPTGVPNMKEAVDRAIEDGNGDLLLNARVRYSWWYIPYVFGQEGYHVEGNVTDTAELLTGGSGSGRSEGEISKEEADRLYREALDLRRSGDVRRARLLEDEAARIESQLRERKTHRRF